jgi:hypothetical protein
MSKLAISFSMIAVPFWGVFKLFLPYIAIIILLKVAFIFFKREIKERKNENNKKQ